MTSTSSLAGKRVLATGGSWGIGAAIVRRLASQGATVAVNHRSDKVGTVVSEFGDHAWLPGFRVIEVFMLGLRGDAADGRALSESLLREPWPVMWRDALHAWTATLEIGAGRYAAALNAAIEARPLWPILSPEDAVEAAMRCNLPEVARSAVDGFAPAAEAAGSSWALGILARCRAQLAADSAGAEDEYLRSIELLRTTPVALALARSYLVYGEWLRRRRRRSDARVQLRAALEIFERLRIQGFAARARAEPAAVGEHARSRAVGSRVQLTPQELQIARMAAEGTRGLPRCGPRTVLPGG